MAETYKSGEKVKYRLAEAMKECMKKAPVEKITVKEITEECGVTRQTFYRNFQDKYDLINWYFDKILIESFEHMGEGQTVYESLVNKFQYIQKETLFFRAAFKNDDQNCLRDHDFELITQFYTDRIEGIVRRVDSGVEYLELQSKFQNGWMPFDRYGSMAATLNKRFGCRKTVDKQFGKVWEKSVVLMDVESFNENAEFEQILGYINTAVESQKKGVTGDVK